MKSLVIFIQLLLFVFITPAASITFELVDDSILIYSSSGLLIKGEAISIQKNKVIGKFPGLGIVKYKRNNFESFKFNGIKKWYREDLGQSYTLTGNHTAIVSSIYPVRIGSSVNSSVIFNFLINRNISIFTHLDNGLSSISYDRNGCNLGFKINIFQNGKFFISNYFSFKSPIYNDLDFIALRIGIPLSILYKKRLILHGAIDYESFSTETEHNRTREWEHILKGNITSELYLSSRIKLIIEYNGHIAKFNNKYNDKHHGDYVISGFRFLFNGCVINTGIGVRRYNLLRNYGLKPFPYADISVFFGDRKGKQK